MDPGELKDLRDGLVKSVREAMDERDGRVLRAIESAQSNIEQHGKVLDATKNEIASLTAEGQKLHQRMADIEQRVAEAAENARKASQPNASKSLGAQFVESGVVQRFVERGGRGTSEPMKVRAITSGGASGGPGVDADRRPEVVIHPMRPLSIRQLLGQATTESNAVEFVRELLFTNAAAPVEEGAAKPESDLTFELETATVKTIAHWIKASKQILADFKQLQSIIDNKMSYGLKVVEEDQILLGDGTGQNLHGLIPQATDYDTALNRPTDTMLDVLRHAILQVRLAFYPASGIVLTPTDWHTIELLKDGENRYLFGSPSGKVPPMVWGLPVAESDALPDGDFLVGAFMLAATLYDREQAQILVSTEDQDNFIKNMVTILCEERLTLTVERPAAIVHGGWPQGASTG